MAITWPAKANYATGDVLTAANMNGVGDDLNDLYNGTANSLGRTAGKNKIINGDFGVNQRAFSSTTTDNAYTFDRFQVRLVDGTVSASSSTFTLGTAPVTGYEGKNFLTMASTGQSAASAQLAVQQSIESVRTFANQTVTISFWAKAASATPKIAIEIQQSFGTGGSPSADVNSYVGQVTLSTSWARYSATFAVPSISGKTIGTNNDDKLILKLYGSAGSNFNARTGTLGIQSNTFDIWGVQVEAGSTATPFQTATGTIQGELAACQRYYWRAGGQQAYQAIGIGVAQGTTLINFNIANPVPMRAASSTGEYSTLAAFNGASFFTPSAVTYSIGNTSSRVTFTVTGAVSGSAYEMLTNNSTSGYIGISAEL